MCVSILLYFHGDRLEYKFHTTRARAMCSASLQADRVEAGRGPEQIEAQMTIEMETIHAATQRKGDPPLWTPHPSVGLLHS